MSRAKRVASACAGRCWTFLIAGARGLGLSNLEYREVVQLNRHFPSHAPRARIKLGHLAPNHHRHDLLDAGLANRAANRIWQLNRMLARVPGVNLLSTNVELVARAPR